MTLEVDVGSIDTALEERDVHLKSADFFDVEALANMASKVLDAPQDYKHLGRAGIELIRERYSLEVCLPRMLALYEDAFHAARED